MIVKCRRAQQAFYGLAKMAHGKDCHIVEAEVSGVLCRRLLRLRGLRVRNVVFLASS